MTISIIIPTLNEERMILGTLAHTATLGFDEIIVVDGGSLDQTRALVTAYRPDPVQTTQSSIRLITAPCGRAQQMNEGARVSNGDILVFLHADTILPDNAPTLIQRLFSNACIVSGRFNVQFDRSTRWGTIISWMMNWRARLSGIATGDQTLCIRRRFFEQIGGFANIPLMEDIEFSRRLKRYGQTAILSATVTTSFRRWVDQGPIRTISVMWVLRLLYWMGVCPQRLSRWYAVTR